eukprot:7263122-Karenia_brevis.AAC.1
MTRLRDLAASGFLDKKLEIDEHFMDHLIKLLSEGNNRQFYETAVEVGVAPYGGPGEIRVCVKQLGMDQVFKVHQGEAFLCCMPQTVAEQIKKCGRVHWGDQLDCRILSEKLNVGFLIFSDCPLDQDTL